MANQVIQLVKTLVAVTAFCIVLILAGPLFIIRWVVSKVGPLWEKNFDKILSLHSAMFVPSKIGTAKDVNVVISFKVGGLLNYERIIQILSDRMIFLRDNKGNLLYPEFQQHSVHWCGWPFWKWDENFNIRNHVRLLQFDKSTDFNEFAFEKSCEAVEEPFNPGESPWAIRLIPNDECYFFLFNFHHSLADGYAIYRALMGCCDSPDAANMRQIPHMNLKQKLWNTVRGIVSAGPLLRDAVFETKKVVPKAGTKIWDILPSEMSLNRSFCLGEKIPMEEIKKISKRYYASLNAVLMSSVASSLRKLTMNEEISTPDSVNCFVTVSVPQHPKGLTNSVAAMKVPVALNMDWASRVKILEHELKVAKKSNSYKFSMLMTSFVGGLPSCLRTFFSIPPESLCCSVFPGPKSQISLDGSPILDLYYLVNIAGLYQCHFTICSYDGNFRIITSFDKNICPDGELASSFAKDLNAELDNARCNTGTCQKDRCMITIDLGPDS